MGDKHHPGIVVLLIYLIGLSSVAGGLSGWIHASGAFDWLIELNAPNWAPRYFLLNFIALLIPPFAVTALWIVQRRERASERLAGTTLVGLLIVGVTAQIVTFFATRDVTVGFLFALAMWVYAIFAIWLTGRISRTAGILLWLPFVWLTFLLVLGFELMRLNSGATYAGGL